MDLDEETRTYLLDYYHRLEVKAMNDLYQMQQELNRFAFKEDKELTPSSLRLKKNLEKTIYYLNEKLKYAKSMIDKYAVQKT